jgi:hypothetical protein
LISKTLAKPTTCKSGAPTLDGGKSSHIQMSTSSTFRTRNALMSMVEEMKKVDKLSFGTNTMVQTRDGRLHTLMKPRRKLLKDLMKNSDSTSTDHSTLDQE